jgi:PAS domain S-box-containing protein
MKRVNQPQGILGRLKLPALILVVLIMGLAITLFWVEIPPSIENPYLTLALNILFNGISAFIIAFISIRGFCLSGRWSVLWFGLATGIFGFGSILGGLLVFSNYISTFVPFIIIFLLSSVLYLVGSLPAVYNMQPVEDRADRWRVVLGVYLITAIIITLIVTLNISSVLQPFIPEVGAPVIQQVISGISAAIFIAAGLIVYQKYQRTRSDFFYWYSLGLILMFLGMAGVLLLTPTVTLFNYLGRVSQLLSGLYFLAAAAVTFKEARLRKIPPEQALVNFFHRQEANLRLLFEGLAEAVIVADRNHLITGWNKAAEEIFGWKIEEVIGKTAQEVFQTKWAYGMSEQQVEEGIRVNGKWKGELIQKHKDGRDITVLASISILKDDSGNILGDVSINNDITELKQAQEALKRAKDEMEIKVQERTKELRESEEKYRLLVENANEAVVVIQNSRFQFLNPKAVEMSGYSKEELMTHLCLDLVHHDDREPVIRMAQGSQSEGVPLIFEFRIVSKDGTNRWMTINAATIQWQGKRAVLGLLMDITERKNLEQQLNEYAQKITQVQEEERKRIAYELHDDTAQYLSILKLQLDSLIHSGKIQDPQILTKLGYLEMDAGRAVDDVRRYSHELRPGVLEHLGLVAALEQIAEDINKLGQIRVEVKVEGAELQLSEDIRLGFFRIAQEAINNARKHSKSSRVLINLEFYEDQVKMTVSDDGVGFEMREVSTRATLKGNLGLMSMQERAKLIKANLKIESKPGSGTRVIVEKSLQV